MDSSQAIKFQLYTFKYCGLLPSKDSSCFLVLWGIITLLWSGAILVSCQAISVYYVQTTNELVEELLLLWTTSTVAIKIAFFYIHGQQLNNMLNILRKLDEKIKYPEEIRAIQSVYKQCNRGTKIYFPSYQLSLVSLCLQLLFTERLERTWKSTAPIHNDFAQLPIVYYSVLVIEAIGNGLNCTLSLALDTYCFIVVNLLAGHIEVLSLRIRQFGTPKEEQEPGPKRLRLLKYLEHFNMLVE